MTNVMNKSQNLKMVFSLSTIYQGAFSTQSSSCSFWSSASSTSSNVFSFMFCSCIFYRRTLRHSFSTYERAFCHRYYITSCCSSLDIFLKSFFLKELSSEEKNSSQKVFFFFFSFYPPEYISSQTFSCAIRASLIIYQTGLIIFFLQFIITYLF